MVKSYDICSELKELDLALQVMTETLRGIVLDRGISINTPTWTWIDRPRFAADRLKYIRDPRVKYLAPCLKIVHVQRHVLYCIFVPQCCDGLYVCHDTVVAQCYLVT